MTIYKPTQQELDSDKRSKYCKKARDERIKLVRQRQMLNRYSNCGFRLQDNFDKQKQAYLDNYVYFELNTI